MATRGLRPGAARLSPRRLKDALVEAARALMAEHGPAGFTLAEAAKRVGVTNAAPYRHFADRSDLMGELARRGFDLFAERLAGAWDEGRPDAYAALRRMGRAYLGFAAAEPGLYAAMFDSARNLRGAAAFAVANKAFDGLSRAAAGVLAGAGAIRARCAVSPSKSGRWRMAPRCWRSPVISTPRAETIPPSVLDKGAEALIEAALRRK